MQRATDSKIQAQVRNLLARKWVDLKPLTLGTQNGVVYLGGTLRMLGGFDRADPASEWESAFVDRLSAEIRGLPDVQDVVFQFPLTAPAARS